jgi:hypothetical protein
MDAPASPALFVKTAGRRVPNELVIIGLMHPPPPECGAWLPDDLAAFARAAQATRKVLDQGPSVAVATHDAWDKAMRIAQFCANSREPLVWPNSRPCVDLALPILWGLSRVYRHPRQHTIPSLRPDGMTVKAAAMAASCLAAMLHVARAKRRALVTGDDPETVTAAEQRRIRLVEGNAATALHNFEILIETAVGRPRLVPDASDQSQWRGRGRNDGG